MEDLTSATAEELQEVVEQASMAKPAARRFYRAIASRGGLVVGGSEEGQTAVGYRSPGRGLMTPDRSQLASSALLLDSTAVGADASVRVEFDSSRVEIERLLRAEIPKDAPLPTSCAGFTNRRAIESLQLSELALGCFENRRMSRTAMAMTPDRGAEASQASDSERREGNEAKLKAVARKMLGRLTRRGLSRAFAHWCVRIFLRRSSVKDDTPHLPSDSSASCSATEGSSQSSRLRASAVDRRRWASDTQARRRNAVQRIREHRLQRALSWWRRWQRWAVETRTKSAKAADTIVRRILNRLAGLAFTRWAVHTLEKAQLQRRAMRVRAR